MTQNEMSPPISPQLEPNEQASSLDPSPEIDPEAIAKDVHRLAGAQHLSHLYDSGLMKSDDEPEQDTAAAILVHPDFSNKVSTSPLRQAASEKLTKRLHKLLEDIGSNPPIADEKGANKLVSKATMFLMKTPGFSKMKAEDKGRVVHRILRLAAKNDLSDLHDIIEHESKVSKAKSAISTKILGLFDKGAQREPPVSEDERKRIKDYVDNDEMMEQAKGQSNYADGGEVKAPLVKDRVASAYPEQAVVHGAAKARIHNYLNGMKPAQSKSLPFDVAHREPHKERQHKEAIDVAARPLSMLDDVKDGSLSPSKFLHFAKMHPEIHELLKKRLTEGILGMQVSDGKQPPFKTRQALSLFMGQPLEQAMSPRTIMAAQATFFAAPPPSQDQGKGSKASLGKGVSSNMTPLQADEKRHTEK